MRREWLVKLGTQFSVLEVGTVGCYLRFSSTVLSFCTSVPFGCRDLLHGWFQTQWHRSFLDSIYWDAMLQLWAGWHLAFLMIWAVAYSLLRRSASTRQAMPITFILLLGIDCGIASKVCVDTLGGSGYCWLFYWELLCLVHFLSNILPSVLFKILDGRVCIFRCSWIQVSGALLLS